MYIKSIINNNKKKLTIYFCFPIQFNLSPMQSNLYFIDCYLIAYLYKCCPKSSVQANLTCVPQIQKNHFDSTFYHTHTLLYPVLISISIKGFNFFFVFIKFINERQQKSMDRIRCCYLVLW